MKVVQINTSDVISKIFHPEAEIDSKLRIQFLRDRDKYHGRKHFLDMESVGLCRGIFVDYLSLFCVLYVSNCVIFN